MTEAMALVPEVRSVELGVIRADRPAQLVALATEAATALAKVIADRNLYSNIQGKKFVKCEGWTTLAAMMGVTPREVSCTEHEGTYTAVVELCRLTDQQVVSRASAECGPDEPTWAKRAKYARRSMALTRATAKACRLAFSWVMALSGYEVTPAEEIPDERPAKGPLASSVKAAVQKAVAALDLKDVPAAIQQPEPVLPAVAMWKGKPLKDKPSDELVELRKWCVKTDPVKWATKVEEIDTELAGRAGE